MDTKLKADIAEYTVMAKLLKLGHRVLRPVGDRLPYDLCLDVGGRLVRIQVKSAWRHGSVYMVDSRRTKTNRRRMIRDRYKQEDFDYAILYIQDLDISYVVPQKDFSEFKSGISLVEMKSRQRPPRSAPFREAWMLLSR